MLKEHPPALIEDGAVEAALSLHVFAGLLKGSRRSGGPVLDPPVLTIDNRVVFADVGGERVQTIMAHIGDHQLSAKGGRIISRQQPQGRDEPQTEKHVPRSGGFVLPGTALVAVLLCRELWGRAFRKTKSIH